MTEATDIFLRGVAVGAGAGMVFLSWLQIVLRRRPSKSQEASQ